MYQRIGRLSTSVVEALGAESVRAFALHVFFGVGLIVGVLFTIFHEHLPARFSFDSEDFQRIAQGTLSVPVGSKYWVIGRVYRSLGLAYSPLLTALLSFFIFAALVALCWWRLRQLKPAVPISALLGLSLVLGSIFLGSYSKDIFVVAVVAALFSFRGGWTTDLIAVPLMFVYAYVFRDYWFIVAGLYVVLRIVRLPRRRHLLNIAIFLAALLAVSLAVVLVLHHEADYFRQTVNVGREGSEYARTLIHPFFSGFEPVSGILNVLVTFIFLQVPLPLLALGGTYYVFLFLFTTGLWAYLAVAVFGNRRTAHAQLDSYFVSGLSLVYAFVITQALFEPDYGSALRHLTPLLPLMVYVLSSGTRTMRRRCKYYSHRRFTKVESALLDVVI